MKDKITNIRGELSIIVENVATNQSYYHIKNENTIVYIGRRDIIRLIGNDNISQRVPDKMKFGEQGHDPSNPTQPLPTSKDDTDLHTIKFEKSIGSTSFEDDTINNVSSVIFETIMESYEGNGTGSQLYSEAGLYTVDETPLTDPNSGLANTGLFAIKNFGALTKTSNLRFIFRWRIIL